MASNTDFDDSREPNMFTTKPILTIFGATGNQGGSVINTILSTPRLASKYTLRGITRDPNSSKSQALTAHGVQMLPADLNNPSTLLPALKDSHGVFGVTDFWSTLSKETEIQQGKNIFDAAKAAGVKHLVWSSLPYAEKISGGQLKRVAHFDSKAIVQEYAEEKKGEMWVSYFLPGMFVSFLKGAVREFEGRQVISMPFGEDAAWPLFDPVADTGKYVVGLFEKGKEADGMVVNAVGSWTTGKEVAELVQNATGKETVFKTIPAEVTAMPA